MCIKKTNKFRTAGKINIKNNDLLLIFSLSYFSIERNGNNFVVYEIRTNGIQSLKFLKCNLFSKKK